MVELLVCWERRSGGGGGLGPRGGGSRGDGCVCAPMLAAQRCGGGFAGGKRRTKAEKFQTRQWPCEFGAPSATELQQQQRHCSIAAATLIVSAILPMVPQSLPFEFWPVPRNCSSTGIAAKQQPQRACHCSRASLPALPSVSESGELSAPKSQ